MNWRPISGWHLKECQKVILKWFPFIDKPGRKSLLKGTYDHLRNFDFIGPGVVSCLVKKKKKNARNSPKLARQIAMPSCRPPLLASWIKKEFLCGSFYGQVMLESVWTKEDEFLCLLVWNCLNVRQKNWLDWPSCFFVLEESEVKTTQKCFKKFLHKDEVISKVKKQKEEDTSISGSIKNHLLGKQLSVTLVKNVANFSELL